MRTPFMQLYIGDYMADTRHLTTEQHGAYLLILMGMWNAGGSLPNDARKLARIAGVSPRRWHLIWGEIGEFFDVDGDRLTQSRLVREYEKAVSKSAKRSASGKLGGMAKHRKTNDVGLANAVATPKHSPETITRKRETNVSLEREAFSAFWDAYGKKTARAKCEPKFKAALRSGVKPEAIIEAARRYAAATPEIRFRKNPETWLNGRCWEDDYTPPERRESNGRRESRADQTERMFAAFDEIDRRVAAGADRGDDGPADDGWRACADGHGNVVTFLDARPVGPGARDCDEAVGDRAFHAPGMGRR